MPKYIDFVEVDVHVAGVLKEHVYKVELSTDGMSMIWRHAIPDYFFESKRMMDMLARGIKIFFISLYKMPRATGTTECTARWNSLDDAKFQSLIKRGYIDINNINPKFIKPIRTRHGWENPSATNLCQNYRRAVKTLRLELDLSSAQVGQKGESCRVFLFLAYSLTGFVLADTLLADTDNKEEDINDKEEEDIDDEEEDVGSKEEGVNDNKKGVFFSWRPI